MSAAELIKQVAALPPEERTRFLHLLEVIKNSPQPVSFATAQSWPDFGERLRRIYGDKVAPDSQPIINEGRGDR